MTTTTKNAGIKIGNTTANSAAQAMTLIGYGDCVKSDIPFRNLDFKCRCQSLNDLVKCLGIIHSYNDFDSDLIKPRANEFLNKQAFYNDGNPNNGNDLFTFDIAREGSPALYVSVSQYTLSVVNVDGRKYGISEFKADMKAFAEAAKSDEFDIEQSHQLTARFWWD